MNFLFLYIQYTKNISESQVFFELKVGIEPTYHAFAERDFTYQTLEHYVDREGFEPPTLGSSGRRSTN